MERYEYRVVDDDPTTLQEAAAAGWEVATRAVSPPADRLGTTVVLLRRPVPADEPAADADGS